MQCYLTVWKAGEFPSLVNHNENLNLKALLLKSTINFQMVKVSYLNVVAVDNIVIREENNAKQDINCVCLSDIFRQARVFSWIPSIRVGKLTKDKTESYLVKSRNWKLSKTSHKTQAAIA